MNRPLGVREVVGISADQEWLVGKNLGLGIDDGDGPGAGPPTCEKPTPAARLRGDAAAAHVGPPRHSGSRCVTVTVAVSS